MRRALPLLLLCFACAPGPSAGDAGPAPPTEPALRLPKAPAPDAADAPAARLPEPPPTLDDSAVLLEGGLLALPEGRSPVFELDVPTGAYAAFVLAYAHEGVHVILERAVSPSGDVVVDDEEPASLSEGERGIARGFPAQFFSANRVVAGRELAAFPLPSTPDVPLEPGTWKLELSSWQVRFPDGVVEKEPIARPVSVAALVMRGPGAPDAAELALTLHLTGADGLDASSAPSHGGLQAALDVVRQAYGAVGVTLADPAYVDVPDEGLRTVVLGEGCEGGDLDELLRHGAAGPAGVDVFVIERFQCFVAGGVDVGQSLGGLSAALPGPPWVRGSVRSGVAVATGPLLGDPERLGLVLAHEVGHFLGLYHTQESDRGDGPAVYDPLGDTPDDERARENLMYFLARDSTALSAGQGTVLRASAWSQP